MPILTDIELEEISLVDKGANPGAKIVFLKREVAKMTPEEILATLPEDQRQILMDFIARLREQSMQQPEQPAEQPAVEAPVETEVEVEAAEEEKQDEEAKADSEEAKADDMEKAKIRKAMEENRELRKRVLDLEDRALMEQFRKSVRAEMPHLPGIDTEKCASLMKNASVAMEKGDFDTLSQVLRACSRAIAKSPAFSELGSGRHEPGSAFDTITNLAKELRKADPKLSVSKARMMVSESHPELFGRYLEETRGG